MLARKIADILRADFGLDLDLADLGKQKNIDVQPYQNVVVGSGVRKAKIYDKAQKCLEKDFAGKQFAFFVCSGDAEILGKTVTDTFDIKKIQDWAQTLGGIFSQ